MEVAIFNSANNFFAWKKSKECFWFFSWFKHFSLIASIGFNRYPLNIMDLHHWMFNFSNDDMNNISFHLHDWNMLFMRAILRKKILQDLAQCEKNEKKSPWDKFLSGFKNIFK